MSTVSECPNFELLFSKKDAILSFSCDDLPGDPGAIHSIGWLPDGFTVEFKKSDTLNVVRFPGAPEAVLDRVSQHQKILIVGLRKSEDPFSPNIEISEELQLPVR